MANRIIVDAVRKWPDSVWTLPENPIWNVPTDTNEVRFDITTRQPWGMVSSVRGLAIMTHTVDTTDYHSTESSPYYQRMRIIGIRNLLSPRQSGYDMEGRVNVDGRTLRAFTSSALFQRPDGTLCNVAVLYCCEPKTRDKHIGADGFVVGNNPLSEGRK